MSTDQSGAAATDSTPAITEAAPTPPAPGYPTKPTVGRVVLYHPVHDESKSCYPALITHVFSDTCVNLAVQNDGSTPLHDDDRHPTSVTQGTGQRSWDWMPYQYAQAAKADAAWGVQIAGVRSDFNALADRLDSRLKDLEIRLTDLRGKALGGIGSLGTNVTTLRNVVDQNSEAMFDLAKTLSEHTGRIAKLEERVSMLDDPTNRSPAPLLVGSNTGVTDVAGTIGQLDPGKIYSRAADSPVSPPCNQADHYLGQAIENLNAYVVSPGPDFPAEKAAALIARIEGVQTRLRAAINAARAPAPT